MDFSNSLKFDDEIFFTFILPPLIFCAGYTMNRRSFFKYFIYVFTYGVIGTICTFSIVAPLTYVANQNKMFYYSYFDETLDNPKASHNAHNMNNITNPEEHRSHLMVNSILATPEKGSEQPIAHENQGNQGHEGQKKIEEVEKVEKEEVDPYLLDLSFKDILLFAAVISSSDAIAALAFISEEKDPKLFAILFGEGVVNDAVCIVIYKIMRDFINSGEGKFFIFFLIFYFFFFFI